MNHRCSLTWAVGGLFLLTAIVYWPALHGHFIWDDDDHITQNPAIVAPDGLWRIWSSLAVSRYYPLTLSSFWLEQRIWGLNAMPYHAVNIALHAFSAGLLFLLLRELGVRGAWVAAALWAVHPVNVDTVAWITEMKNTLSGAFFFLSLLCYLRYQRQQRARWYALALISFAAALASKPSTVTLPLVLLLLVWWQRCLARRDLWRVTPFVALSAGMSLLTIAEQQRHMAGSGYQWTLSVAERLVLMGRNLWFYAGKLVWPMDVTFVYPRWEITVATWGAWLPLAGAMAVGIILWRLRAREWARATLFGLGYFVAALLPVLGLFDIYYFRFSFVADHFQYLAGIGLIAPAVAGATAGLKQRTVRVATAGVALTMLAGMSWGYSHAFHDNETLWRDTLAKNPQSFMPQSNLGQILFERGDYAQAGLHLREALRLQPSLWEARVTLATTLAKLGQTDDALSHYRLALKENPRLGEAHFNLGLLLAGLGRTNEAIDHLRQAVALLPEFAPGYWQLGRTLADAGQFTDAIETLRRGLKADPHSLPLANELSWLLATCPQAGLRDAAAAVRIARQLQKRTAEQDAGAMDTLAAAYAAAGRFDDAVVAARKAQALARQNKDEQLAVAIGTRLAGYERREPYRLPSRR